MALSMPAPCRDRLTSPVAGAVDRVVLVHRLREVIAQVGFTRFEAITPNVEGELEIGVQPAALAREISWLPAVENRGEGHLRRIQAGCDRRLDATLRGHRTRQMLMSGFDRWRADHNKSRREFPGFPYVMLHTLSHLLMTAVALECGYPASSIRERVYAGQAGYGILIYTGSPDAEGTLGGLVEAGRHITGISTPRSMRATSARTTRFVPSTIPTTSTTAGSCSAPPATAAC